MSHLLASSKGLPRPTLERPSAAPNIYGKRAASRITSLAGRGLLSLLIALSLFSGIAAGRQADESKAVKPEPSAEAGLLDDSETSLKEILEGHSIHGDAFNEGPRQRAYLMGGTGNVSFPVTTGEDVDTETVQAFVNQGVGQLHGFWYLEAERSFRQAAAIDPQCAMAYWGAAMATTTQRKRARGFIAKAVELKDKVSERERMYIEALDRYLEDESKESKNANDGDAQAKQSDGESGTSNSKKDDYDEDDTDEKKASKKQASRLLKDFESIVIQYPDDLEAKAFVAHRIWYNAREGIPIASYLATEALLNDIFAVEPLHPSHHYTIHLWDLRHPENALAAAARCGVSAPSIAHMWHMPGHIYSRLKRYEDAVYQQEASARVDHAHMMRDAVMPDEINNFAHNNEWLIRNLIFVGRAHDAVDLAMNMTELPQHPKYNTLEKRSGSASYGRRRLLQSLREFQLFDEILAMDARYLKVGDHDVTEELKSLRLVGTAAAITRQSERLEVVLSRLDQLQKNQLVDEQQRAGRVAELEAQLDTSFDRPPRPQSDVTVDQNKGKLQLKQAKSKLNEAKKLTKQFAKVRQAIEGYSLVAEGDFRLAAEKLTAANGEDVSWIGELKFLGGETEEGLKSVADQVRRRPQEVIPLARLAYLQYQNGDVDLAKETFAKLRDASASMDLDVELFSRLTPIAREFGFVETNRAMAGVTVPTNASRRPYDSDWRKPIKLAADLGFRPPLDSLGPFRWSPYRAPKWTVTDSNNFAVGSKDFTGQPHIVIFYLGHGCLHCAEQLQAFAPRVKDFEAAGLKMLAISSDDLKGLQVSVDSFNGDMPFRLASDETLEIFKRFRAYDDFESQPLHGTFLIDGKGFVRWQDISYEPFMEPQFLLDEAQRLLGDELRPRSVAGGASSEETEVEGVATEASSDQP